ncbi:FtsX-like permease family protein [Bacteroides sp.]|uniref:ABC transporter permease n=1 Tax=Bacteroides sp. TaxID=29523 RepID=UPI0026056C6A|nr:FtsX-like permease family protein [Bacteroides sp.]
MRQIYYTLQTLLRRRGSQTIKIVSLALGLMISVFLFARIAYELSYDSFWRESQHIYFVGTHLDKTITSRFTSYAISGCIGEEFPEEVESVTTCYTHANDRYYLGSRSLYLSTIMGDTLFFATLGLDVLEGNPQDLANPSAIFLSHTAAQETFGNESPLGKTIIYVIDNRKTPLLVKGIFADVPSNTSLFAPQAVVSIASLAAYTNMHLGWNSGGNFRGFVRLRPSANVAALNERLTPVIQTKSGTGEYTHINPIRSLHTSQPEVKKMIWIMALLGVVLLFTTALNYVLISIASLSSRAKAIGVHKCSGASDRSIFSMFLTETALVIALALLLIGLLVYAFSEAVEELVAVPLNELFAWSNLWVPLTVVLVLFFIGGFLPGILFSRIPVTQVFKRYIAGRTGWKRVLLFVQFGFAAFVVGMLLVVLAQYSYVTNRDRGYRSERVVFTRQVLDNPNNLCSVLRGLPYVESVASAGNTLGGFVSPYEVRDSQGNMVCHPRGTAFDKDFLPFMELRLAAGKNLSGDGQLLVNRKFVELMKWPGDGIGEQLNGFGVVVGLLEGFSFYSVPEDDESPIMITWEKGVGSCVHVRLKEPFTENRIKLNEEMKQVYPAGDVEFYSLDDIIRGSSRAVLIFCCIVLLASVTILFILLMGLIGYVNDEIRLRSKEIAIRKVNGAEAGGVLRLLSRDVLWLAIPAIVIGTVGAFKAGKVWISQFVDTVHLPVWWYIVIAVCLLIFIALCVIVKTWGIACENPVNRIKNE